MWRQEHSPWIGRVHCIISLPGICEDRNTALGLVCPLYYFITWYIWRHKCSQGIEFVYLFSLFLFVYLFSFSCAKVLIIAATFDTLCITATDRNKNILILAYLPEGELSIISSSSDNHCFWWLQCLVSSHTSGEFSWWTLPLSIVPLQLLLTPIIPFMQAWFPEDQ